MLKKILLHVFIVILSLHKVTTKDCLPGQVWTGSDCVCKPCTDNTEKPTCGGTPNDTRWYFNQCWLDYSRCVNPEIRGRMGCENMDYCSKVVNNNGTAECNCAASCNVTTVDATCGTNLKNGTSKFYLNKCHMEAEACSQKTRIVEDLVECGANPKYYCNSPVQFNAGKPECTCQKCGNNTLDATCGREKNNFVWFYNYCHMKALGCELEKGYSHTDAKGCNNQNDLSYCMDSLINDNGYAKCNCEETCADENMEPVCGKRASDNENILFTNICHLKAEKCKTKTKIDVLTNVDDCREHKACPEGFDNVNGRAMCKCQTTCQNSTRDVVCGRNRADTTLKMYYNECHLKAEQCKTRNLIDIQPKPEECDAENFKYCKDLYMIKNGELVCDCTCPDVVPNGVCSEMKFPDGEVKVGVYFNTCQRSAQACANKASFKQLPMEKCKRPKGFKTCADDKTEDPTSITHLREDGRMECVCKRCEAQYRKANEESERRLRAEEEARKKKSDGMSIYYIIAIVCVVLIIAVIVGVIVYLKKCRKVQPKKEITEVTVPEEKPEETETTTAVPEPDVIPAVSPVVEDEDDEDDSMELTPFEPDYVDEIDFDRAKVLPNSLSNSERAGIIPISEDVKEPIYIYKKGSQNYKKPEKPYFAIYDKLAEMNRNYIFAVKNYGKPLEEHVGYDKSVIDKDALRRAFLDFEGHRDQVARQKRETRESFDRVGRMMLEEADEKKKKEEEEKKKKEEEEKKKKEEEDKKKAGQPAQKKGKSTKEKAEVKNVKKSGGTVEGKPKEKAAPKVILPKK